MIDMGDWYFENEVHKQTFYEMIEDMYLSEEEKINPTPLLKRQIAFVYLIALYKEDYLKYEGEMFYIEFGEELSIGGPTYLMDERYGYRKCAHEKIIPLACEILKGQNDIKYSLSKFNEEDEFCRFIAASLKQAVCIIEGR